jgi:hypothetical protein
VDGGATGVGTGAAGVVGAGDCAAAGAAAAAEKASSNMHIHRDLPRTREPLSSACGVS